MIYKAKEGSEAYNYLKDICEQEEKERKDYLDRVEKAVGFKVERYSGYQPNRTLYRKYEITNPLVDEEQWQNLDKKIWKMVGEVEGYHQIAPNRRTKLGKKIDEVFRSCKVIKSVWQIHKDLGIPFPDESRFTITQLLTNGTHYFIYIDNTIRADKFNDDLEEITMGQYEDMIKEE